MTMVRGLCVRVDRRVTRTPRPTVGAVCTTLAGATVLTGCLALLGWWTGVLRLTSVIPNAAEMRPNTALCLSLLGVALLGVPGRRHRLALGTATVVLAVALTTLVEILAGWDLRIDTIVPFVDFQGIHPRMAPATATVLSLLATSALLAETGRRTTSQLVALPAFMTGYVAVIGYLYGTSSLYTVPGFTSVAGNTAAALTALALVLLMRPQSSVLDVLLEDLGTSPTTPARSPASCWSPRPCSAGSPCSAKTKAGSRSASAPGSWSPPSPPAPVCSCCAPRSRSGRPTSSGRCCCSGWWR